MHMFMQQRMWKHLLCWVFSLPPPDPRLAQSLAWSVPRRPACVDWINGLHGPGCQLGLANGESWQEIRESKVVVFISLSLPSCCCSFWISLWKATALARWPSVQLSALSLGSDDHFFPWPLKSWGGFPSLLALRSYPLPFGHPSKSSPLVFYVVMLCYVILIF